MFVHASVTVYCIWASTRGNTFRGRFIWLQRKADSKAIWLLNLLDCTGLNFHWFCSQKFIFHIHVFFLYCSTSFGILSSKNEAYVDPLKCYYTENLHQGQGRRCILIEKHCFLLYTVQNKSHFLHGAKPFLVGWCKLCKFIWRAKLLSVEAD